MSYFIPSAKTTDLLAMRSTSAMPNFFNVCAYSDSEDEDSQISEDDSDELAELLSPTLNIPEKATPERRLWIDKVSRAIRKISWSVGEEIEVKRIDEVVSNCAVWNVLAVEEYLDFSEEKELFLQGRDGDGNTILILAAIDKCPKMVSLI